MYYYAMCDIAIVGYIFVAVLL